MADSPGILRFGVFEVNLTRAELRKNGSRIKLQEQPFQVLVTLLKRPGEIVTREELKEKLWAGDTFVDFDHSLSTAVNKIREALGDSATSPRFVETVPRKGYRFVGGTAIAQGGAVEVPQETPAATIGNRRWWPWGLAGIVLVALGVYAFSKWQNQTPQSSVPESPLPLTSLVGSEERPAFSPDATRVAFSWSGETGDNVDIYVQVVGSSHLLRLTSDSAIDETPSWSPDGRQIAFMRTSGTTQTVYSVSPVGGPEKKVIELSHPIPGVERSLLGWGGFLGGGGLAWTPDGKSILFCDGESPGTPPAIYRLFLETGEKQRLTSPPAVGRLGDAFPAVAPDGRTLAFVRGTNTKREIYLAPLAGGEPWELTSQGQITAGLAWAADGREIVYAHQPAIGSAFRLSRISVSGGDPRPVAETGQNVAFPSLAPQGKRLVYERVNFDVNVWLYPLPGEERDRPPRRVVASTQMDFEPRFSPDGSRIVFGAAPRGNWDIFVVDAQGGPPRQLTNYEGSDSRPSWSKDGRWIYFGSDRGGSPQIWKVSPDGTETVQVTQRGGFHPFESPDGRFLYFARAPGNSGVWRVPVEGGQETAVRVAPNTAAWAVGEDGFYFVEYREAPTVPSKWFLRLLRAGATEPIDVMEVPPLFGTNSLDIAPDGRWFAYAQSDRVESDLMMLENFE